MVLMILIVTNQNCCEILSQIRYYINNRCFYVEKLLAVQYNRLYSRCHEQLCGRIANIRRDSWMKRRIFGNTQYLPWVTNQNSSQLVNYEFKLTLLKYFVGAGSLSFVSLVIRWWSKHNTFYLLMLVHHTVRAYLHTKYYFYIIIFFYKLYIVAVNFK